MKLYVIFATMFCAVWAQKQQQQYTTPVPILKQINKHNEDGSYSYGYEAADGSYKIESKYPNGEVYGKYGYVDDQGQLREVEYGASRRGFEPAGSEINAAPPTLNINNNAVIRPLQPNEEDDGQYREDPAAYYKDEAGSQNQNQAQYTPTYQSRYTQPQLQVATPKPAFQSFQSNNFVQQQPKQQSYTPAQQAFQSFQPQVLQPNYQPQKPAYQPPQQTYQPQQQSYQPQQQTYQPQQQSFQPQTYQQPAYQQPAYQPPAQPAFRPQTSFQGFQNAQPSYYNSAQFNGHPATNVDINSGSYTVQYK